MCTGVFQGEGSAQLLFTLFINHISSYVHYCELRQFADDTSISIECNVNSTDIENAINKINKDLESIDEFCNLFQLIPQNLKRLLYHRNLM